MKIEDTRCFLEGHADIRDEYLDVVIMKGWNKCCTDWGVLKSH